MALSFLYIIQEKAAHGGKPPRAAIMLGRSSCRTISGRLILTLYLVTKKRERPIMDYTSRLARWDCTGSQYVAAIPGVHFSQIMIFDISQSCPTLAPGVCCVSQLIVSIYLIRCRFFYCLHRNILSKTVSYNQPQPRNLPETVAHQNRRRFYTAPWLHNSDY